MDYGNKNLSGANVITQDGEVKFATKSVNEIMHRLMGSTNLAREIGDRLLGVLPEGADKVLPEEPPYSELSALRIAIATLDRVANALGESIARLQNV